MKYFSVLIFLIFFSGRGQEQPEQITINDCLHNLKTEKLVINELQSTEEKELFHASQRFQIQQTAVPVSVSCLLLLQQ